MPSFQEKMKASAHINNHIVILKKKENEFGRDKVKVGIDIF